MSRPEVLVPVPVPYERSKEVVSDTQNKSQSIGPTDQVVILSCDNGSNNTMNFPSPRDTLKGKDPILVECRMDSSSAI